jgi:hypothetical protein
MALVVLLPDWRGQSPLARGHADFLASLGCTVLIADLYGDGFIPDSPDQVGPLVQRLLQHRPEGVEALAAAVDRLREESSRSIPIICAARRLNSSRMCVAVAKACFRCSFRSSDGIARKRIASAVEM